MFNSVTPENAMFSWSLSLRDKDNKNDVCNSGCHTFSEDREWVIGEWRMRKKRSQ